MKKGTVASVRRQAGLQEMKYLIIIEKDGQGCSAYVPDLPGCVAAGDTEEGGPRTYPGGHPVTSKGHARNWTIPFRNLRAPPSTSKPLHDLALS